MQHNEWVLTAKSPGLWAYLKEFWTYRRLFRFIATKILEKQYQRSMLGRLWIVLRPMITVLMYTVLFGFIFNVDTPPVPYVVFLILGFAVWSSFEQALNWATRSIEAVRGIAQKVYFPKLLIPIAGQTMGIITMGIFVGYLIFAALYYWIINGQVVFALSWELLGAIVALALTFYFSIALSLWTSLFDAIGRDMRYSLRYLMQAWMFFTPVVYSIDRLPEKWRWLMELNPLAPLVINFRAAWLAHVDVVWQAFLYPFFLSSVILICGLWVFLEFEGQTVEAI